MKKPRISNQSTQRQIISLLLSTQREGIMPVIAYMLHKGFFTNRCKSHHQYQGGLADHALEVYRIASRLRDQHEAKYKHCRKTSDESLILCCILHDLCKTFGFKGRNGETYCSGHGARSLFITRKLGLILTEDESAAIRCHMGVRHPHGDYIRLYDIARKSRLWYYVHKADGISASQHHHDGTFPVAA